MILYFGTVVVLSTTLLAAVSRTRHPLWHSTIAIGSIAKRRILRLTLAFFSGESDVRAGKSPWPSKRSLYLIFAFRHAGTGSELPPEDLSTRLKEPVQKPLELLAQRYSASSNVDDYQFLDWELQPIASCSTIASVPNPGVVFIVHAATPEGAIHLGINSKKSSMNSGVLCCSLSKRVEAITGTRGSSVP